MSCSPMTLRTIGNAPVWQLSIGLAHLIVGGVCTIQPTILQAQHTYELLRIPADPAKGFLWPYYLSVPSTLVRRPSYWSNQTIPELPATTNRFTTDAQGALLRVELRTPACGGSVRRYSFPRFLGLSHIL